MVANSPLSDATKRRHLLEGGRDAIAASKDPLIMYARELAASVERVQQNMDEAVIGTDHPLNKITKERARLLETPRYPAANRTLRLSYGVVKGYQSRERAIPYKTTFHGLFDRHASFDGVEPFDLPARFREGKERLDLSTPLDWVCTVDFAGGNSGSPVVNQRGELVGVLFDGNMESFELDLHYTDAAARAIAVDVHAITMVLRALYDAGDVADEIEDR
jgi:hypothetical protein